MAADSWGVSVTHSLVDDYVPNVRIFLFPTPTITAILLGQFRCTQFGSSHILSHVFTHQMSPHHHLVGFPTFTVKRLVCLSFLQIFTLNFILKSTTIWFSTIIYLRIYHHLSITSFETAIACLSLFPFS